MPAARRIAGLTVVCLLAAACGTDEAGDEGDPPTTSVSAGTAAAPTAWTEESVEAAAASARAAVDELAGPCADLAAWMTDTDAAAQAVDELAAAITSARRAEVMGVEDWVAGDDAVTLVKGFEEDLAFGAECGEDGDTASVGRVTGAAMAALDRLRSSATGSLRGESSRFWLAADYLGHSFEVDRILGEEGPIEVLVLGDSVAKQGVDPLVLEAGTGARSMNAATDGQTPRLLSPWFGELAALGAEPAAVVVGITSFGGLVPCSDIRADLFADFQANRELAFAGVAAADDNASRRALGAPTGSYDGPLWTRYLSVHEENGHGRYDTEHDRQFLDTQQDYYATLLADPQVCEEAVTAFDDFVRAQVEADRAVVAVALPLSSDIAALHPDGRAGHDAVLDRYRLAATDAGAGWLDLSGSLDDDQFGDLTHPTPEGAVVISEAIAAAL